MIRTITATIHRWAAQARAWQQDALASFSALDEAFRDHMAHGAMSGTDPLTDSLYGQLEGPAAEGAQAAIGYGRGMQSRWQRVVAAWRNWRCSAWLLDVPQSFFTAHAPLAAGGLSKDAAQPRVAVLNCSQRKERCEVCPRFHAHRHGLAIRLDVAGQLDVARVANKVKAQPSDRDGEVAQVHHVHADVGPAVTRHECPAHPHLQPHTVSIEGAPPVQHPKHRADDGRRQCDGLQHCGVHANQHSSAISAALHPRAHPANAAWWLTGITLLAALVSAALLTPGATA